MKIFFIIIFLFSLDAYAIECDVRSNNITFYDNFFKEVDKQSIVGHELSHLVYKGVSTQDLNTISDLSGWTLEIKDNKVYEVAPKLVIKDDSIFIIFHPISCSDQTKPDHFFMIHR